MSMGLIYIKAVYRMHDLCHVVVNNSFILQPSGHIQRFLKAVVHCVQSLRSCFIPTFVKHAKSEVHMKDLHNTLIKDP